MKSKILWFALAFFLALSPLRAVSSPLEGGYTMAETASMALLEDGIFEALELLRTQGGEAGTESASKAVMRGVFEMAQCAGWLMHVNVAPNSGQGEVLLAKTRAEVVATAWSDCDRAAYEMRANGPAAPWATNARLTRTLERIAAMDRTLAYATPWPVFPNTCLPNTEGEEECVDTDEQNQFGPHGLYSVAQRSLYSVVQYALGALNDGWLSGQEVGALPVAPGVTRIYAELLQRNSRTFFLSAHVLDPADFPNWHTDAEAALPALAKRALTEIHLNAGPDDSPPPASVSYGFRFVLEAAGSALRSFTFTPASGEYLWEFLRRIADSWENAHKWLGYFNGIF